MAIRAPDGANNIKTKLCENTFWQSENDSECFFNIKKKTFGTYPGKSHEKVPYFFGCLP